MTRGPSSTLDTLKFEAALGAQLKMNLMTYYMEYQFAFRKHPKIGPPGRLADARGTGGAGRHSPGRCTWTSWATSSRSAISATSSSTPNTPPCAKRRTCSRRSRRRPTDCWTTYTEVCPLLPFPWFNVCCDETWGLGTGPSKELAAEDRRGRRLRAAHPPRPRPAPATRQKRMMMWGDIILQHPDKLPGHPQGHDHAHLGLRRPAPASRTRSSPSPGPATSSSSARA